MWKSIKELPNSNKKQYVSKLSLHPHHYPYTLISGVLGTQLSPRRLAWTSHEFQQTPHKLVITYWIRAAHTCDCVHL